MEFGNLKPGVENSVCLSAEDLLNTVLSVINSTKARGAYVKIFGKDMEDNYLLEMLVDGSRILAIECSYVQAKKKVVGEEAIKKLAELVELPLIVSVYPLDDNQFRLILANNLEVYSQTPAVPLSSVFKKGATRTIESAIEEAKEEKEEEIQKIMKKTEEIVTEEKKKKEEKKEAPIEIRKESKIEVVGDISEEVKEKIKKAIRSYVETVNNEITSQLNGAKISSYDLSAQVGEGVIHISGEFYVASQEGGNPEILKRRVMFTIHKHLPRIRRDTDYKPLIKSIKVNVIAGGRVESIEEKEREDVSLWRLTKPKAEQLAPNLYLAVDPQFRQYFVRFSRTLLKEIEANGVLVDRLFIEVLGGVREFEINIELEGKSKEMDEARLQALIVNLARRHASELSKIVGKYVWVNKVEVSLSKEAELSTKAVEILKKKESLEKEVEKMLREAGIEELNYLLEDKKKEVEENVLKARIETSVQMLRQKMQDELRSIPRANLRWLKLNYEPKGSSVELIIEASLAKIEEEGLFGALSSISDEEIKRRATEVILRVIREVSQETGVQFKIGRLSIIVR